MPEPSQESPPSTSSSSGSQAGAGQITPELVEKVADKVIEMLLLELKHEYERCRWISRGLKSV